MAPPTIQDTIGAPIATQEIEITNKPLILDVDNVEKGKSKKKLSIPGYQPKLPYPTKAKKDQQDEQFKKFVVIFKILYVNITFVEALA